MLGCGVIMAGQHCAIPAGLGHGAGDVTLVDELEEYGVMALARAQLRETEKRMRELRSLQAALKQLVGTCSGGSAADCRILAAMNGDGLASNRPGEPRWA